MTSITYQVFAYVTLNINISIVIAHAHDFVVLCSKLYNLVLCLKLVYCAAWALQSVVYIFIKA